MEHINKELVNVLSTICDSIGTPLAAIVKNDAVKGEWTVLQKHRADPSLYTDPESFWKDNLVCDLLRKQDIQTNVDKEAVAVQTFHDCEKQCCLTNARLHRFLPDFLLIESGSDLGVYDFISHWRKNVNLIFGNVPTDLTPRFSGGATYDDIGKLINLPDKMSSTPTVYSGAQCILPLWYETSWHRVAHNKRYRNRPKIVDGNIFFTVPKDAEKRRGCGKEASIPLGYQLAVGQLLKKRLLVNGLVDLSRGKDLHQNLARKASIEGHLATIDMSNASDTVSKVLVELLLPTDWYTLLDSLRAHKTRVNGKWYRLEKFSSMGNGFTFELETIIFLTLARTVCDLRGIDSNVVKAFGDDLIIPTEVSADVLAALQFFGFTVNKKKSFVEGPFRESCGGDFFAGVPVRAHYVKELLDEPSKIISLMNGLRRTCTDSEGNLMSCRWIHVVKAWQYLLRLLPSDIARCRGPIHLGDVVIHDIESTWHRRSLPLNEGGVSHGSPTQVRTYSPVHDSLKWHHWTPDVQLACCTLGVESTGITPRDAVSGYRFRWVTVDRLVDLPNLYLYSKIHLNGLSRKKLSG